MPLTYWARDRTAAGSLCRATERYDGCDRKGSRRDERADVEVPLRALQLCVGVSDAPIVCRPTGLGHRSYCDLDGGLVHAPPSQQRRHPLGRAPANSMRLFVSRGFAFSMAETTIVTRD